MCEPRLHAPTIVLSGPVGVGKTSVGQSLADLLVASDVAHTYVDLDQLSYTHPRAAEDPWSTALVLDNLRSVWRNGRARGATHLLLSHVVEDLEFVKQLRTAVDGGDVQVVQLQAPLVRLHERLELRERGASLVWHKNRAIELHRLLAQPHVPCDLRLDTRDLGVDEVALKIYHHLDWHLLRG